MAKFILIDEQLINLDNIKIILPYEAEYSESTETGVQIEFIGEDEPKLIQNISFEEIKELVLSK